MKQVIGAYLLMMVIGSTLDWVIVGNYLEDYLKFKNKNQYGFLKDISSLTVFILLFMNIGMLFRIWLYGRFIQIRIYMPTIAIIIYTITWLLIAFLLEYCQYLVLMILIVSFLNGVIFIDPIERILYIYKAKREKVTSIIMTGFAVGWLFFTIILQFAFNPYSQNDSTAYFEQGCLINVIFIVFFGFAGCYFFYSEPSTKRISFALELANKRMEYFDIHSRDSVEKNFLQQIQEQPFLVVKSWQFYRIVLTLFFFYCCGIGSIIFLHRVGESEFIYYILEGGFGIIIGELIPLLIPIPFPQKPVILMINLIGMVLLLLLGFFNVNGMLQEIFFFFQMVWFGVTINLGLIICGLNFGWFLIVEIFPLIFTGCTIASFAMKGVSLFLTDDLKFQGILLIEQIGLIIGFLINTFRKEILSSQQ